MRTIEIDFDIHKLIEAERGSFSDSPNEALRRLLGLGASPNGSPTLMQAGGSSWSGRGVTLPHGTQLRMTYNGRQYTGVIDDGAWLVEGERFTSPSAAAGDVVSTKDGRRTQLNGWIYWYCKRPGDTDWATIKELALERHD